LAIADVIAANDDDVADIAATTTNHSIFFVGQTMKAMDGKANRVTKTNGSRKRLPDTHRSIIYAP